MERTDIIKLVRICSANYRNWPENGKEEDVVMMWEMMLSDVEVEVAKVAIQKHMTESVYPPTVADIRKQIAEVTIPQQKTAIEAWGEVTKAIRKFGSYRQKEALESLSPLTRQVVDHIGFRYLCMSEDEMADRAHFTKAYDAISQREQKDALMPLAGRELIQKLQLRSVLKRLPEADESA